MKFWEILEESKYLDVMRAIHYENKPNPIIQFEKDLFEFNNLGPKRISAASIGLATSFLDKYELSIYDEYIKFNHMSNIEIQTYCDTCLKVISDIKYYRKLTNQNNLSWF